jgi:hypothetical protein
MRPSTEQRIEVIRSTMVNKYGLQRMHGTTVDFIAEILDADPLTKWAESMPDSYTIQREGDKITGIIFNRE